MSAADRTGAGPSPLSSTLLAVPSVDALVFGVAPKPVHCGHGVMIGAGTVIPEINFTLPPMSIEEATWGQVRREYTEIIEGVCQRAVDLDVPALLVEFETLPPMTVNPAWGLEITRLLADTLAKYHDRDGLKCALRLTPNDSRDHERPPRMRSGPYWDGMVEVFRGAAGAGADMLAIESTGGKEVCDEALMSADLRTMVFALGVLAPRDMQFLWSEIVTACREGGIVPSGDTACGFANTALALAEQKMLPRVFAAVVRVASVPRGLVAYEQGAVGPSKDCAYEGPYMKAICGVPISMEGRSAACAHLSSMGNIAQAVCDCWSNESVQNVRLLSASAPVVSMEQLAYDCRLLNLATSRSREDARLLRDLLVDSDASLDPQAYVLRPDVVLRISAEIVKEVSPYLRTRRAVQAAVQEIRAAHAAGGLRIAPNEVRWLDRLARAADALPDDEGAFIDEMMEALKDSPYLPAEYDLPA
ncbi:MAG TPA: methyltransferase MtaB domain-containing protein [Chthonomonadales bacterium]|nr:methyltransferase MtaB domain-containing protein [Chthonomonadales bacterium]